MGNRLDPSKFYLVRGSTLAEMDRRIDRVTAGDNIQRGPGVLRRGSGKDGFTLAARRQQTQVPPPPGGAKFPFQISTRVNPSNPFLFQAYINFDSTLMLSMKPNDNLSITGLGTWFPLLATDVIALYIVIADFTATRATIQSYGLGTTSFDPTLAAWSGSDNSYVFNDGGSPPNQIGANILIGYSTPDGSGNPYVVQAQSNHVLLENCDIDGYPAVYDFSHRDRYGITA